jgi:hypothetical protein
MMATATRPAPSEYEPADGTTSSMPLEDSIGGPVWVAWREGTLTRAAELEALCAWVQKSNPRRENEAMVLAIRRHLEAAREAARVEKLKPHRRFRFFRNGPLIERATSNLDAAEAHLLNLAPSGYILGQMPCLLRHVQCHLPSTDPRRHEFEAIAGKLGIMDPDRPRLPHFTTPGLDARS